MHKLHNDDPFDSWQEILLFWVGSALTMLVVLGIISVVADCGGL